MSKGGDTSLGGPAGAFPETHPDVVDHLKDWAADPKSSLEEVCRRYWKPVYRYVRSAWAKSNEEAKDLTQAFFLWLLEGDALAQYAPERGSFRTFFRVLLRRFVGHREAAAERLKRGGGVRILSDQDLADLSSNPAPASSDPDGDFDRAWAVQVLRYALLRVEAALLRHGRDDTWRLFAEHDLCGESKPPSYAELAERHGLAETQVRDRLAAVRREVRREMREELARLTTDEAGIQEEWKDLVGP